MIQKHPWYNNINIWYYNKEQWYKIANCNYSFINCRDNYTPITLNHAILSFNTKLNQTPTNQRLNQNPNFSLCLPFCKHCP